MKHIITCPHCKKRVVIDREVKDKKVRCKQCSEIFVANSVPYQSSSKPAAKPAGAPKRALQEPASPEAKKTSASSEARQSSRSEASSSSRRSSSRRSSSSRSSKSGRKIETLPDDPLAAVDILGSKGGGMDQAREKIQRQLGKKPKPKAQIIMLSLIAVFLVAAVVGIVMIVNSVNAGREAEIIKQNEEAKRLTALKQKAADEDAKRQEAAQKKLKDMQGKKNADAEDGLDDIDDDEDDLDTEDDSSAKEEQPKDDKDKEQASTPPSAGSKLAQSFTISNVKFLENPKSSRNANNVAVIVGRYKNTTGKAIKSAKIEIKLENKDNKTSVFFEVKNLPNDKSADYAFYAPVVMPNGTDLKYRDIKSQKIKIAKTELTDIQLFDDNTVCFMAKTSECFFDSGKNSFDITGKLENTTDITLEDVVVYVDMIGNVSQHSAPIYAGTYSQAQNKISELSIAQDADYKVEIDTGADGCLVTRAMDFEEKRPFANAKVIVRIVAKKK